jgi:hypothetical protein
MPGSSIGTSDHVDTSIHILAVVKYINCVEILGMDVFRCSIGETSRLHSKPPFLALAEANE